MINILFLLDENIENHWPDHTRQIFVYFAKISVISSILQVCTIATFRSENEYEIEYEYDFSNLVRRVYINTSNINLVPRAAFSTGQQQGGTRALGT